MGKVEKKAQCPICTSRLFDYNEERDLEIEIKCKVCKSIVITSLNNREMNYKVRRRVS